jgi:soluble lytic murein transglycosylase
MKRWLAALLVLAACAPEPSPLPPTASPAVAAAIPEGRTPAERRELFQAALSLYQGGDLSSAERLFTTLATVSAELADYALRDLATIAQRRGDTTRATALWQALLDRYPDSVWKGEAELAIARVRVAENNYPTAANLLTAARQDLKDAPARAAALFLASDVAERQGNAEQARSLANDLRAHYPQSPEAATARERAWQQREAALASSDTAREEIGLLLGEGQASRALELGRLAQARFRSPSELPELLWLEASAAAKAGRQDDSLRLLEEIRARYPQHPVGARALFRLGSSAWNHDDDETALRLLGQYARQYPHGAQAAEAVYAIARIHQEAQRWQQAAEEFARLVRLYPKSSLAAEARFRVAWCEYRAAHRARAAALFAAIADGESGERAGALYWKARAADDADDYETVLREFPESYYASLAEQRLGRPPGVALAGRLPPMPASLAAEPACNPGDFHLVRFDELKAMGLVDFARGELAAYETRVPGCDAFLIRSWLEVRGYRQAVGRAIHAGGCGIDGGWFQFCYPLAFWDVVRRETAERALDPYLVAALIRQESLFDAQARSSANAIGLMQLLPATGQRTANEMGRHDFQVERLVDPDENVALGTSYLRKLLDRYAGNVPRALAAYNAGENAVDKWQRRYTDVDDDEFVESISYRETRTYVKRVLQNRRIYQALYANAPLPAAAVSGLRFDRPQTRSAG